jgi:beta-mannanase
MTTPFSVSITATDNVTGEAGSSTGTFNVNNVVGPPPPASQCTFGIYDPSLDGNGSWTGPTQFQAAPIVVATHYVAWDEIPMWPSSFANLCLAHGAIPFVELEPWNSATGGATWPAFNTITSGSYDSQLTTLGSNIATFGHTTWLTFAHEMNGNWYPWGNGGPQGVTPTQWIAAWKHVHDTVNATAGGHAKWVWAPNNNDVGPVTPYWPGASYVDVPAYDGYLNAAGQTFASFQQGTVNEIKALTSVPIWNAECGIEPADGTRLARIAPFIAGMKNAGMAGFMHWNQSPFNYSTTEIAALTGAVNAWNA